MLAVIAFGFMGAMIAFLAVQLNIERLRAVRREQELLAAVLSKDADEYTRALESLKQEPHHKIKAMELENELALKAAEIENAEASRSGFPV